MRLSEKLDKLESQARWMEYLIDGLREAVYWHGLWNAASLRYTNMLNSNAKGDELKEMGYIMDGYMHAYQRKAASVADSLVKAQIGGVDLMREFHETLQSINRLYQNEKKTLEWAGDVEK